jgi:UDP-3-O-[3-hydroxymyristoyl] glucosamine N-acyltransferase LpxD
MGGVNGSQIAEFLEAELFGEDIFINSVSSLSSPMQSSLVFAKEKFSFDSEIKLLVLSTKAVFNSLVSNSNLSFIIVTNPRLAFAKVIQKFFIEKQDPFIHPTAIVAGDADIHSSVSVGAYTVIESGVSIGEGTVIKSHVVISENVKIGKFCYIKSGAVVGEEGFGFDFEEDKTPIRLPHLGSVVIGDHVEIGSNSTVARGTLDNTIICAHTKIDDLALVAHNSFVGIGCIITGCTDISGSVKLGNYCWLGPNSVIQEKTEIGDNCFIGMGSVVRHNLAPFQTVLPIESLLAKDHIKVRRVLEIDRNGKYNI